MLCIRLVSVWIRKVYSLRRVGGPVVAIRIGDVVVEAAKFDILSMGGMDPVQNASTSCAPAHLQDLELPLNFIIIGIRRKLLLECSHFRLQLCFFPLSSFRTFFVVSCKLSLCNGQL